MGSPGFADSATISGNTITGDSGGDSCSSLTLNSGTLDLTPMASWASLSVTNGATISGGTLSMGSGTLSVGGALSVAGTLSGGSGTLSVGGALSVPGTLSGGSGTISLGGTLSVAGTLSGGTGTISLGGASSITGTFAFTGVGGTINGGGGGGNTLVIASDNALSGPAFSLVNHATLQVQTMGNGVSGGTFSISSTSTLQVDGTGAMYIPGPLQGVCRSPVRALSLFRVLTISVTTWWWLCTYRQWCCQGSRHFASRWLWHVEYHRCAIDQLHHRHFRCELWNGHHHFGRYTQLE